MLSLPVALPMPGADLAWPGPDLPPGVGALMREEHDVGASDKVFVGDLADIGTTVDAVVAIVDHGEEMPLAHHLRTPVVQGALIAELTDQMAPAVRQRLVVEPAGLVRVAQVGNLIGC